MRLVNMAMLDQMLPQDRLNALGLIGDGIDQYQGLDFAFAIGDKLYEVAFSDEGAKLNFCMLLSLELGTIDGSLVALPLDPETWRIAALEYDAFIAKQDIRPQMIDKDPIGDLKRLRNAIGEAHAFVMLGRAGIAIMIEDEMRWMLSYRSFQVLAEPRVAAPELLDFDLEPYSEKKVLELLWDHEDRMAAPYHDEGGMSVYIGLLAIERGRILASNEENAGSESYKTGRVLTLRR